MKRTVATLLMTLAAAVPVVGCSGKSEQNGQSAESKAKEKPALFRSDLNALDKAKGVQGTRLQDADRQRQSIEDQSH